MEYPEVKKLLNHLNMKFRNLDQLKNLTISKKFAHDNNLKIYTFEKGDLVFYNDCFLIHTYAFTVENIPYIDFYFNSVENVLGTNIDLLLQKANLGNETKKVYENIKNHYLTPVSWDGESNWDNCLKMEQNYITYLSVLNIYLPKVFSCDHSSDPIQKFESLTNEAKIKFKNLAAELIENDVVFKP